jgi:hypothetical protein
VVAWIRGSDIIMRINAKRAVQTVLGVLLGIDYLAAKIHFFTHYDASRTGDYFREHVIYWAMAAALTLLICVVEKSFQARETASPRSRK